MSTAPLDTLHVPAGPRRILGAQADDLAGHHALLGPLPPVSGATVTALVDQSGLRGRGGAGFPTIHKIRAVRGRNPVVVANATEGEPLSSKDAWLLSRAPHLVLDGLVLAARAVGAREGHVVAVRPDLVAGLRAALAQRSRDGVRIEVTQAADRFISGEETSVVSLLNRGPGLPTDKLTKVFERGVQGRPTLVSNAETLAHLALIARYGADWFRTQGTVDEPGTMLTTVSGAVANPGIFEVPLDTPLADLMAAAGARPFQAVLVGGFHGAWIPARTREEVRLSRHSLQRYGAAPGAGVVMVLGRDECGLREAARIADYLAGQSARQCGPCVNGLPRMADSLARLAEGSRDSRLPGEIGRLQGLVRGRGACSHPDGTARFVASTMTAFADEVAVHLSGGCSAATSR